MPGAQIEQLHYTWTSRGVEGINRFQIAAMSPGCRSGPLAPILGAARKLCRYDRPPVESEPLPISFGWLEHRGYRIAFHRVGLPPSKQVPGNFAAHLLLAPAAALPEAALARLYGASFWWRGASEEELAAIGAGRRDFELPAIELEELLEAVPVSGAVDPIATAALAHALFSRTSKRRLEVIGDPAQFGSTLAEIGALVPEALGSSSLSTYEGAATFPFRVIGVRQASKRQLSCSLLHFAPDSALEREAVELLVGGGPVGELLREIAARRAATLAVSEREAFWAAVTQVVSLTSEEGSSGPEARALLADPAAFSYVLLEERGRDQIALALCQRDPGVLRAMEVSLEELEEEREVALAAAIAKAYHDRGDLAGLSAVAAALASKGRAHLLDALLAAALGDEHVARTLESDDLTALLMRAAERQCSPSSLEVLFDCSTFEVGRFAALSQLPDTYLAAVFSRALVRVEQSASLAAALRIRPGLARELGTGSEEEQRLCLQLLEQLHGSQLGAALGPLLPIVCEREEAGRLTALVRRLPADAAAVAIKAAGSEFERRGQQPPAVLSEVCDREAARLLQEGAPGRTRELLALSRSADHRTALRLLGAGGPASLGGALEVLGEVTEIEGPELREALTVNAIDDAVRTVRQPDDAALLWEALERCYPEATLGQIMLALLGYLQRCPRSEGNPAILAFLAREVIGHQPKLASRWGGLADDDAEQRAQSLAAAISPLRLATYNAYVAEASERRAHAFWRSLAEHRAKQEKRRHGRGY